MDSNCTCPVAGYCARHKRVKSERLHKLCKTSPGYFQAWEKSTSSPKVRLKAEQASLQKIRPSVYRKFKNGLEMMMNRNTHTKPGDSLHFYLDSFGFKVTATCPCNDHIKMMNTWGIDTCLKRVSTITSWLKREAKRRSLPFNTFLVKRLVLHAILKAKKNQELAIDLDSE